MNIEIETLRIVARYDPVTGKLYWNRRPALMFPNDGEATRWNNRYSNKEAFVYIGSNGYARGAIFNKRLTYKALIQ